MRCAQSRDTFEKLPSLGVGKDSDVTPRGHQADEAVLIECLLQAKLPHLDR